MARFFLFLVFAMNAFAAEKISSSPLAEAAMARVGPSLRTQFAAQGLVWGAPLFVRIFKASAQLEVWVKKQGRYTLFKSYPICTYGGQGLGPKIQQGDGMAPEGFYSVAPRQLNPYSQYHLAFNLGYPNAYDRAHGRTGSALMVHGNCVSIGCYAMTDALIEEIYTLAHSAFSHGQAAIAVHIFPFRMDARSLEAEKENPHYAFWKNLQQGYALFEAARVPPQVTVDNLRYRFSE
jgi:murein L,D-transpeptidase YafK